MEHLKSRPRRLRRLVVPAVLAVATLGGAIAALTASSACGDSTPAPDASVDAAPDTPIV